MLISPSTLPSFDYQAPLLPFLNIIPKTLDSSQKVSPEDFIRRRKLPFPKVIISTLSLVANGNHNGVDNHIGTFFRNARHLRALAGGRGDPPEHSDQSPQESAMGSIPGYSQRCRAGGL